MACWSSISEDFRWRTIAPFGVEIDGDFQRPLTPAMIEKFVALYRTHGWVLARGQSLNRDQQIALLGHVGPILEREGETGYISTNRGGASLSELRFHADGAYAARPLDAISLHAVDVTDGASSTRFVSSERAWTALSPTVRTQLIDKEVRMISPAFEILGSRACDIVDPPFMQSAIKPLCYMHDQTGDPCLWVSEMHAASVVGMPFEESRTLLQGLFDFLYDPDFLMEHRWHRGDIVIWDNVRYQHARGPLAEVGRRVLQRVIVGTEGRAPHIAAA